MLDVEEQYLLSDKSIETNDDVQTVHQQSTAGLFGYTKIRDLPQYRHTSTKFAGGGAIEISDF